VWPDYQMNGTASDIRVAGSFFCFSTAGVFWLLRKGPYSDCGDAEYFCRIERSLREPIILGMATIMQSQSVVADKLITK
jgi:hypothetical protein